MKEILFFWKKSGVLGRKLHFLEAKRSFRLCSTLFPMVFDVCKMYFLLLTVRLSSMFDCLRLLFVRIIWCLLFDGVRLESRLPSTFIYKNYLMFLFDGVRNQSNNFPFLVNRNPSKTVENHRFCRGQYAFHQFDTRKTTQQKEHQISPSNSKYMNNTSTMNNFSLKNDISNK